MPIDDDLKGAINMGGSLAVGLMNGKLMGGFVLPSSQPLTVAQFPAAVTDSIAASMRAAASSLGIPQEPVRQSILMFASGLLSPEANSFLHPIS
ncbi:hypothetical protein J2W46_003557 [Paraburkholderia strydomiana]|nr:hypothetical protein [Paraburkholderia strydomiana]